MTHNTTPSKNILVAPLNWGLGHATRCIPVIKALQSHHFNPIIASDGVALELLRKEFPELTTVELPSYQIEYPKNGAFFKLKLLANSPKILRAILAEEKATQKIVTHYNIEGVISDNRLGVRSTKVPSVFITHQLNVMTGNTTWLTTKMHHYIIKKFNECWVPDVDSSPNLSGRLGHLKKEYPNIKYMGVLSRLEKKKLPIKYPLMVILSGPEPQRTLLEEKLIAALDLYPNEILFVKGKIEPQQTIEKRNQFTFYNYMNSEQLEVAFNESHNILCRSGYTTVMDLAKLGKKVFFIPTPGQFEQEYLAEKFEEEGIAPFCTQNEFNLSLFKEIDDFIGFERWNSKTDWPALFRLFRS